MRRRIFIAAVMACALFMTAFSAYANEKEQQQVVQEYLRAYARNENAKMKQYLVQQDANQFGPYPFTGTPVLQRPKVDDNQALIEFSGKVGDSKFPDKGGILCYKRDGVWLVRQVLFYEKVPGIFNLPKKSVTEADRKSEPTVANLGERFMNAWRRGDTETLLKNWHRWMDRQGSINNGISMSNYQFTGGKTGWGDAYGAYQTKLTYKWGVLSYTMKFNGGLMLAQENGTWKIRGNIMVLNF